MLTTSVALCSYNGEEFLAEQLRSIGEQTQLPDELIIIDDRSTDKTIDRAQEFASRAPFRVRVLINETTLGSTRNFEKAIGECTGDLIFLCDQDDVWTTEKIAVMTSRFEADPDLALLFSDAEIVDDSLDPLGYSLWDRVFREGVRRAFVGGRAFEELLWQNRVTGAALAFRSRYRERVLPIPNVPGMIHDGWIAIALAASAKVDFIDERLILYRQHHGQQLGLGVSKTLPRAARFERDLQLNAIELERIKASREVLCTNANFADRDEGIIDEFVSKRMELGAHYSSRASLPRSFLGRIPPVLQELATGRYGRFSRGMISAAKDLFGE